ncbi:MAG: peptide-methionine (S)-S-oxide reductase MsrA [Armatimonadetes bacterium]|nr:peptide-methionine (S)-S-oxide reductase MsrA [Armatimonadota bacterium]
MAREIATFAAGCFWGVEHAFRQIEGVVDAACGYTGGHTDNPSYREVCSGATGHAEAVKVEFDPEVVSYDDLLNAFWQIHDPTQVNRQGADVGTQYRSAIFYHSDQQRGLAEASKERWAEKFSRPIVTQIVEASEFWPAEEYHQRYFEKNGVTGCHVQL